MSTIEGGTEIKCPSFLNVQQNFKVSTKFGVLKYLSHLELQYNPSDCAWDPCSVDTCTSPDRPEINSLLNMIGGSKVVFDNYKFDKRQYKKIRANLLNIGDMQLPLLVLSMGEGHTLVSDEGGVNG